MAITNDLDFWLMGHSLQVRMENAAFGIERFAVSIALSRRIEALSQLILCSWGTAGLVLEDHDVRLIDAVPDDVEVFICESGIRFGPLVCSVQNTYLGGYRSTECSLSDACCTTHYLECCFT